MKTVAVCLVTWPNSIERIGYLKRTIDALRVNLAWSESIKLVCSVETQGCTEDLLKLCGSVLACSHFSEIVARESPANLGANMNRALQLGRETGAEYLLLMQDDFILTEKLDLDPYCQFLAGHLDFAMVRFCWAEIPEGDERQHWTIINPRPAYIEDRVPGDNPEIFSILELKSESTYFYADHPQLRRANFPNEYGWFKEGGDLGEPEVELNGRLKGKWRIAASHRILFQHCGEKSSVTEAQRFGR